MTSAPPHIPKPSARVLLPLAVGCFLVLAAAAGGVFVRLRTAEMQVAIAVCTARVDAVADARKRAVQTWLAERRADAELLAWDTDLVGLCLGATCPAGIDLSNAQIELDDQKRFSGFVGAYVFDRRGDVLLDAQGGPDPFPGSRAAARRVVQEKRYLLHDIHRPEGFAPVIGFLAPVFQRSGPADRPRDAPVVGVVGLYVRPEDTLFPLLVGGDLRDSTLETFLVRREGAGIRVLSPLRLVRSPILDVRMPRTTSDSAEGAAAQGREVSAVCRDYRGKRVVAAVRWISEAGWGLVAKVDEDEALAGWRQELLWEGAVGTLGLACLGLGGLAAWRAASSRRYRLLLENLRDREEKLRALAFGTEDLITIKNRDGHYELMNPAAERVFAATPHGPPSSALADHDRAVLESGRPFQGEEDVTVGAETRTFLAARIPLRDSEGHVQGVAGVLRDITDRKRNEKELADRARTLEALYRLSLAVTVAKAAGTVLDAALDGAVETMRADFATLFMVEEDGQRLTMAGSRRLGETVRERFERISRSDGVAGRAIRTGKVETAEDYPSDPDAIPGAAEAAGIGALASVPLKADGRAVGVLSVGYRTHRRFVSADRSAIEALGHMVGVALSRVQAQLALEREARVRRRAEEGLRRLQEATARFSGKTLFAEVARSLSVELGARWVWVLRAGEQGVAIPLCVFQDGQEVQAEPFPLAGTPCGEVVSTGQPVLYREEGWRFLGPMGGLPGPRVEFYLGSPLIDTQGRVMGVLCTFGDRPGRIGEAEQDLVNLYAQRLAGELERIQTEDSLVETRRALGTLIQNLPGAVYRSTPSAQRRLEYVSPACEAVTGYGPTFFVGEGGSALEALIVADDLPRVRRGIEAALYSGKAYELEYRVHDRSGGIRWVFDLGRAVGDESGPQALEGVLLDQTERKLLEAQLTHSQRMEALGRLAGGVAHDFNNLLTAISGYAELLLLRLPQGDRLAKAAAEISKAGERAANLTRQLLAFSRRQEIEPKQLDFNEAVSGVIRMLGRLLGEEVEVVADLPPGVGCVRADPSQLDQVVLNLCVNARDAMPRGGRLTIRTRLGKLPERLSEHPTDQGGEDCCILEVSDTGAGIRPELLDRIFEPFFTTKGPDQGTGLGLSTVYGIVKQAGGHVTVDSRLGSGTTFHVFWPSHATQPTRERQAEAPPRPGEGLTVLVAEDDDTVRQLTTEQLRDLGYSVTAVASGAEALRETGQLPGLHLLITDVVMPGMRGPELAQAIRRVHPDLPVVFMSGHIDETLREGGMDGPRTSFLQKPFRLNDLVRAMEAAVGTA